MTSVEPVQQYTERSIRHVLSLHLYSGELNANIWGLTWDRPDKGHGPFNCFISRPGQWPPVDSRVKGNAVLIGKGGSQALLISFVLEPSLDETITYSVGRDMENGRLIAKRFHPPSDT